MSKRRPKGKGKKIRGGKGMRYEHRATSWGPIVPPNWDPRICADGTYASRRWYPKWDEGGPVAQQHGPEAAHQEDIFPTEDGNGATGSPVQLISNPDAWSDPASWASWDGGGNTEALAHQYQGPSRPNGALPLCHIILTFYRLMC
eukprot:scaffold166790_cov32-Prasinocladus_malaysianus.AAC.1